MLTLPSAPPWWRYGMSCSSCTKKRGGGPAERQPMISVSSWCQDSLANISFKAFAQPSAATRFLLVSPSAATRPPLSCLQPQGLCLYFCLQPPGLRSAVCSHKASIYVSVCSHQASAQPPAAFMQMAWPCHQDIGLLHLFTGTWASPRPL